MGISWMDIRLIQVTFEYTGLVLLMAQWYTQQTLLLGFFC